MAVAQLFWWALTRDLVALAELQEGMALGKIRRHASFRGLRDDKDPQKIRRETAEAEPR